MAKIIGTHLNTKEDIASFKNKNIDIYVSVTHITPTYTLFFYLNEIKKLQKKYSAKIYFVMWDTNALVNPFFKKLLLTNKVKNKKDFIEEKEKELRKILEILDFDMENLHMYRSSDLWKKLVNYADEDLFQEFYSVVCRLQYNRIDSPKVSHFILSPMDIYFCNNLYKICPEDISKKIDVTIPIIGKENIYESTRDAMMEEGLINEKLPFVLSLDKYPFIMDDLVIPNWDHTKDKIRTTIKNCNLSKKEIIQILNYLDIEEKSYESVNYVEELQDIMITHLYDFLKKNKNKFLAKTNIVEEKIKLISDIDKIKEMGKIIKSDISLKIIYLADGKNTVTDISKKLKKSVATISMYIAKLKKMDAIRTTSDNKIRRNLKGIKINFESGIF
ncbi:MAG: ArsR family transcriptional regulator [archaeon]